MKTGPENVSPESEPENVNVIESPGLESVLCSLIWSPSIAPNTSREAKSPLCEPCSRLPFGAQKKHWLDKPDRCCSRGHSCRLWLRMAPPHLCGTPFSRHG